MARYFWNKKTTVEECRALGVNDLRKIGVLDPGEFVSYYPISWKTADGEEKASIGIYVERCEGRIQRLRFAYAKTSHSGERESFDYGVGVETTPCYFGGIRYWFICPLSLNDRPCCRRVGKLYLPPGARYYGCRHCYNLTYKSCQEHDKRVDALLRDPQRFLALAKSSNLATSLLLIKAATKALTK